jgi:hypothetical protein
MNDENKNNEKELETKLNKVLNTKDCKGEECQIQDPEELVHRENKKIITNDGRQLLSEYTTR